MKNKVLHPVNRSLDLCPPVPGVTALDTWQIGRRLRPQDPGMLWALPGAAGAHWGGQGGPGPCPAGLPSNRLHPAREKREGHQQGRHLGGRGSPQPQQSSPPEVT